MKILCIGYRDWAIKIYKNLENKLSEHEFIIIDSVSFYKEINVFKIKPDLILWYGWSELINTEIIDNFFSVMLHPSPLPKFRGGSPIQNQIINGKLDSAVSIFKISEKLDEGDIIYQKYLSLEGELSKIFSEITKIGTKLSIKMINNFKNLKLKKQDNSVATYYSRRKPSQSEITINEIKNLTANDLYNKIRSLQDPYPNAFIKDKNGNKLFIVSAYTDKKK
tara:strand:+ start:47 stop:712 length:666 start_codon:yes stop_codon:yes gene_type:complete